MFERCAEVAKLCVMKQCTAAEKTLCSTECDSDVTQWRHRVLLDVKYQHISAGGGSYVSAAFQISKHFLYWCEYYSITWDLISFSIAVQLLPAFGLNCTAPIVSKTPS